VCIDGPEVLPKLRARLVELELQRRDEKRWNAYMRKHAKVLTARQSGRPMTLIQHLELVENARRAGAPSWTVEAFKRMARTAPHLPQFDDRTTKQIAQTEKWIAHFERAEGAKGVERVERAGGAEPSEAVRHHEAP
jgi:hypothetical protein